MANIINAIINLINNSITEIKEHYTSENRMNNNGKALEIYVKNLFSDAFYLSEEESKEKYKKIFSHTENKNNPPDLILKLGDAIEVKKIESEDREIALNSSYPKAKLYSFDEMLTAECKKCEDGLYGMDSNGKMKHWDVKDIIYIVGVVNSNMLETLCMVYGEDYAASFDTYKRIKKIIKDGVEKIDNVKSEKTKELGRFKKVDPLGITYLRIRGMWEIKNPLKTFEYIYKVDETKKFNFMCIINEEKWNTFDKKDRQELQEIIEKEKNAEISDVKIKDPNNPKKSKSAKLITFKI